jgi:hypothetical protein
VVPLKATPRLCHKPLQCPEFSQHLIPYSSISNLGIIRTQEAVMRGLILQVIDDFRIRVKLIPWAR